MEQILAYLGKGETYLFWRGAVKLSGFRTDTQTTGVVGKLVLTN
jgi:hypothetical protein